MTRTTAPTSVVERTFRAMASPVVLRVVRPTAAADRLLDRAQDVVREVERHCSRFDVTSALSVANASPDAWHVVPGLLADAIEAAHEAHLRTGGLFDPRVGETLRSWGYDRTLPFAAGDVDLPAGAAPAPLGGTTWTPKVVRDGGLRLVHLGGHPVDLGGIGKGLAVRWAAAALADAGDGVLVDAGGDQHLAGDGPAGDAWRVGVQDPHGGTSPVLVLAVRDAACATSSIRLRRWRAGGVAVHHLVDPRTGRPGGDGLAAVTVVDPDPAWAEVRAKTLFLAGAAGVRDAAEATGLAAAWVTDDGLVGTSLALDPLVTWRRDA